MMRDNKQPRDIKSVMLLRLLAVGYVLYMLYQVVMSYIEGGPDAPSVGLLILSIVLLGGGAALIGILSWREYSRHMQETAERKALEEAEKDSSDEEWEEDPADEEASQI